MTARQGADGAAGARRAAAVLGVAICAETTVATMAEDARKVDLKVSFGHAHRHANVTVHCQIKSGPSYRAESSTSDVLTFQNIDRQTIDALADGQPSLLAWVPPPPSSRIYFHLFRSVRHKKTPIKVPKTQYVTPALLYDLSRMSTHAAEKPTFSRQDVPTLNAASLMERAREAYKELKIHYQPNPFFGPLNITRKAWRHVTRRSRTKPRRILSLRVVPYLRYFLERVPDRYQTHFVKRSPSRRLTTEVREVVCRYKNRLFIDGQRHDLLVRIHEEIWFPTNWFLYPLARTDIRHSAALVGWWCKPAK